MLKTLYITINKAKINVSTTLFFTVKLFSGILVSDDKQGACRNHYKELAMSVTSLKGTITGFKNNEIIAVVATEYGEALLDINEGIDYRLRVGDMVEVEDASYYVTNGRAVTILGYKYCLNGDHHTIKEN